MTIKSKLEINNFPRNVVKRVFRQVEQDLRDIPATDNNITEQTIEPNIVQITLPYAGKIGETMIKEINKEFIKLKDQNLKPNLPTKLNDCRHVLTLKIRLKMNTCTMSFTKSIVLIVITSTLERLEGE